MVSSTYISQEIQNPNFFSQKIIYIVDINEERNLKLQGTAGT